MPIYQITSIKFGVVLGLYEADDEQGARNAMARGAGFEDEAQATEARGDYGSHIRVSQVASATTASSPRHAFSNF